VEVENTRGEIERHTWEGCELTSGDRSGQLCLHSSPVCPIGLSLSSVTVIDEYSTIFRKEQCE
jgi:hypothetical protein